MVRISALTASTAVSTAVLIASEIPASTLPVREELVGVDEIVPTEDNEDILKFISEIPLSAQKKIIDTGDFE